LASPFELTGFIEKGQQRPDLPQSTDDSKTGGNKPAKIRMCLTHAFMFKSR